MNKRMVKALKDKYIYVDIDGTLAEYRFNNHVSAKCCFVKNVKQQFFFVALIFH